MTRFQLLQLVCLTLLASSRGSNYFGRPSSDQQSPSSNNYWYQYWYDDKGNGGNHFQGKIPASDEVGNSYEWHSTSNGQSGENAQRWSHNDKRQSFNIPGILQGNPGLKNGNNYKDFLANLFGQNGNSGSHAQQREQNDGFKLNQPNTWVNSFQQWLGNAKKGIENLISKPEGSQRHNDGNANTNWYRSYNNQWQRPDSANFQPNRRNFQQNDFDNYSGTDEGYDSGLNLSEPDEDVNFPDNGPRDSTGGPPLSFWFGAGRPAPTQRPNAIGRKPVNRTRENSNPAGSGSGVSRPPTAGSIDPSVGVVRPSAGNVVPTEDELPRQTDLLVEAQQVCGRGSSLYSDTSIRIAGGHDATEMYPWLVAIYQAAPGKEMQFICGGSLITSKHAISAAHCFLTESMQYEFIVSNNRILKPSEAQRTLRRASGIMLHPGYNPQVTPANADVAVVIFERPVEFGEFIKPICLWRGDTSIRAVRDQMGRIVGWGAQADLTLADELPLEINMGILDYRTCIVRDNSFINVIGENSFCTGYRNGSGPCRGDSGSGFMIKQDGRWSLRGVVSLTTQLLGCDINHYVGLTDVAKYLTWVSSILRSR